MTFCSAASSFLSLSEFLFERLQPLSLFQAGNRLAAAQTSRWASAVLFTSGVMRKKPWLMPPKPCAASAKVCANIGEARQSSISASFFRQ